MPRRDANPGQQEAAAERRERAFQLRKRGLGFRAIGKRLGVSHVQAYRDVKAVLQDLAKRTQKAARELRQLESERLDFLWLKLLPKLNAGEPKAVQAAVRLVDRRARLFGLDAAKTVEVSGPGGQPIAFIEVRLPDATSADRGDNEGRENRPGLQLPPGPDAGLAQ